MCSTHGIANSSELPSWGASRSWKPSIRSISVTTCEWVPPGAARRVVGALAFLPVVAAAQRPLSASTGVGSLPPAWEVIDRHLEAAGGRAAFLRLTSREVWARYEIPARRLTGELRVFSSRPDRLLIKTEYPELGVAVTGFNGSVGWTANP